MWCFPDLIGGIGNDDEVDWDDASAEYDDDDDDDDILQQLKILFLPTTQHT